MSMNAVVLKKIKGDKHYKGTYIHFDGEPGNTGHMLLINYSDSAKLDRLIKKGAIRSLGPDLGTTKYTDLEGMPIIVSDPEEVKRKWSAVDWIYVWEHGSWRAIDGHSLNNMPIESAIGSYKMKSSTTLDNFILQTMKIYRIPRKHFDKLKRAVLMDYEDEEGDILNVITRADVIEIADASLGD